MIENLYGWIIFVAGNVTMIFIYGGIEERKTLKYIFHPFYFLSKFRALIISDLEPAFMNEAVETIFMALKFYFFFTSIWS